MANQEQEITTVSEKGQVVIPLSVRRRLGIKPKTRFVVYGEGDTVIMTRIELPNMREEWKRLRAVIDKRIARYGEISDEEISEIVQKHRHERKR